MKYNLAGIDMNVDQLRHDQIQELTRLLITLKSEYDELIRETIRKKNETELLSKQCEALEKIERKIGDQHCSLEHNLQELKKQIEVKHAKLEEEIFLRDSMLHVLEKLKEEILHLKKNMNNNEIAYTKNQREYEKQKLKSTEIKEKLNQIHQKINDQKRVFIE
jgi:chromosome segregation ATPase